MRKEKQIISACLCLFLLILLANTVAFDTKKSASAIDTETPRYGGVFTLAIVSDPDRAFFPATTYEQTKQVLGQIYSALIEIAPDLEIVPDLATNWTISADGKTYTFLLNQNATFSDSTPVTSQDVNFTIMDIMLKYHPNGPQAFGVVDRIETPDNHTVVFQLKNAFAPFIYFLSSYHACILPKHLWEGTDPLQNPHYHEPVGSGPFVLEEYKVGESIILKKNPNYWKPGLPYLDKLVFKIIPDGNVKMMSLQRHDVDACLLYNPASTIGGFMTPPLSDSFATTFDGDAALTGIQHIDFNLKRTPMNDTQFRKAVAYAINKRDILDVANTGMGTVVDTVFPSGIWQNTQTVTKYEYSPSKAEQVLDAAGYTVGQDGWRIDKNTEQTIDIGISSISTVYDNYKACEVVRDFLREVKVKSHVVGYDAATFVQRVFVEGDFDTHIITWSVQVDPSIGVARFCTNGFSGISYKNSCGYNSTKVNGLFANATVEPDVEKRKAMFFEIQKILSEDCIFVPTYQRARASVFSRDFKNVVTDATDYGAGFEETWWVKGTVPGEEELAKVVADIRSEVTSLASQVSVLTNLLYVAIAVSVILPIIVIAVVLRKKK